MSQDKDEGAQSALLSDDVLDSSGSSYTGVVVIHGLGDTKRNTTLQDALNSLTHWFNQVAGLDLRNTGPGRLWLTTRLRDDGNPDSPAASAMLDVLAPNSSPSGDQSSSDIMHLRFREVWWAESLGIPNIGATLRWARIQAQEQARHLLLPLGIHGSLAPPMRSADRGRPTTEQPEAESQEPPSRRARPAHRRTHAKLKPRAISIFLVVYGLVQFLWKTVQWLILTPVVLLLLVVLTLLRPLGAIPFLKGTIIDGFTSVMNYIMLHWVSEMHVYLLDYTRSSTIRERFKNEFVTFFEDPNCQRVVVIAHSWGTVVAYEGLTDILTSPQGARTTKDVTFVCLAAALRRGWLLREADPHRLHGVLPDHVEWLHFFARYDPVAAGPLTSNSLPPFHWSDRLQPSPATKLKNRLGKCKNYLVVNSDSIYTDHDGYWENIGAGRRADRQHLGQRQ